MPISSKQFFTENSSTDQICAVLYMERIPKDYEKIFESTSYGYITSPVHVPDKGEKEHIHVIIRDMHGRSLDFNKVSELLESLNENHARPVILRGGHAGLVDMARYFVHLDCPDKQQFDLRPIEKLENIKIDDKGICEDTKLQSIYAENYCFFDGGGLDFIKLIHETAREKAERRREYLKQQLDDVLEHIYNKGVKNYAKLVKWCRENGYLDCCIAYNSLLHNVINGLGSKDYNFDTDARKTHNNGIESNNKESPQNCDNSGCIDSPDIDYTAVSDSDINDLQDCIETSCEISNIDIDAVRFFAFMFPAIALSSAKYNKLLIRRKFLEIYSISKSEVRRTYKQVFDNFCITNLHKLVI